MTEIEKELERFISSGEATTSIDNSGFQTTHIDPLKIAKHFAQWQKEQMMKGAVDAHVNMEWNHLSLGGFAWSQTGLDLGDKCKLIIIKE